MYGLTFRTKSCRKRFGVELRVAVFVSDQTPMRLSDVPLKLSEIRKNSGPVVSLGRHHWRLRGVHTCRYSTADRQIPEVHEARRRAAASRPDFEMA